MEIYKYVALGNDFFITEYNEKINYHTLASSLCKDHFGLGADGLIVVSSLFNRVYFYNKDGSSASMCGNGIRCAFYYLYKKNPREKLILKVNDVFYDLKLVSLNPFFVDVSFPKKIIEIENMNLDGEIKAYKTKVGNEHLVIIDDNKKILSILNKEHNDSFKINIDVVNGLEKNTIQVDSFERGVGKTLSCGTGALASSLVYKKEFLINEDIEVKYPYGSLKIREDEYSFHLIGEARFLAKIEVNVW